MLSFLYVHRMMQIDNRIINKLFGQLCGKLRFKKNFTTYLKMVFLVTRIPHKWFYKSFLFSTKTSSKGKAKAERMWQIKRKIPQMSSPNCKIVLYSDKNLFHHFSSCCIAAHHFIQWFLKIPALCSRID